MVVPLHRVNFWADLGQFSSVLVNLLCPVHSHFQDTSVGNADQTNALEEKRCKFAPDTLIARNSSSIMGDNVNLRSYSSIQGHVQ